MYSLTLFKNKFDTDTSNKITFGKWSEFEDVLFNVSKQPGNKGGPNSSPLMSPAIYKDKNSKRSNDSVFCWSRWVCVDVDDYDGPMEESIAHLKDTYYVCYSTASSTIEKPKFRLVFPITHPVPRSKIKHMWHSINNFCLGLNDAQTKDLSRMYYIPAKYPNANNFIFKNEGEIINTFSLMEKYPWFEGKRKTSFMDSLPDSIRKELSEYRRSKMDNFVSWADYKDCPFFPKDLGEEYSRYAGVKSGGNYFRLYKIMVSIAGSATKSEYPITSSEITEMCRDLDNDSGGHYKDRNMEKEAERALDYVSKL